MSEVRVDTGLEAAFRDVAVPDTLAIGPTVTLRRGAHSRVTGTVSRL